MADMTPGEAAAAGLGWVPKDHPLYGTAGYVGYNAGAAAPPPTTPTTPPAPTGAPGATDGTTPLQQQGQNAQTYSQTPGATPTPTTTNQGTQDVVRNSYLQQATQGTTVDTNDPNFRQQADTYAAAQERARRGQVDDASQAAFASGTYGSGAQGLAQRMAGETSARNVGEFESGLVGQELQARRNQIADALTSLKGMITSDQTMQLQQKLADMDAAIKQQSLAQSGSLGGQELSLRDKLGTGALNIDMIRALLQNQQFGQSLGLDIGQAEFNNMMRLYGL